MLTIALKEWTAVCDLLVTGRTALVLRKGGIHESDGSGVFRLDYPRFVLFPSWLHQKPELLKPQYRDGVCAYDVEPATLTFHGVAEAAGIWKVPSRAAFDVLDDLHPWTAAQIDMRFNYRPANPIYVVALHVSRLGAPKIVANTPAYGGCRSWVPLTTEDAVDDREATAVMDDGAFGEIVERANGAMGE